MEKNGRMVGVNRTEKETHRYWWKYTITDPIKWLNDDKVGNQYRYAPYITNGASFALQNTSSQTTWNELSTQVSLMGDALSAALSFINRLSAALSRKIPFVRNYASA